MAAFSVPSKVLFLWTIVHVSLQQSHRKHMGISSDGHASVHVCVGIAAMRQGLQAWLRRASLTPPPPWWP